LINNDFDGVFATISGAGAYYDDGVTVKFAGVADNTNGGGTFGAGVASIDRSNGYFNQISVQSDYAYMSVEDTVNGIVSDVFAYTHSLSLGYASAPSATIEEITLSDYGIKNTITGTFSIQDIIGNDLVSVSDTGTVSIYGLTNSADTNVVTWNSTTKQLGYRSLSSTNKSSFISGASFSGVGNLKYGVTFSTAFPDTSYGVQITGEEARTWTVENKLSTGFLVNSNSSIPFTSDVFWFAIPYGQ
jgi:hypothetical protein